MSLNTLSDKTVAKIVETMLPSDRVKLVATNKKIAKCIQSHKLLYKYGKVARISIWNNCSTCFERNRVPHVAVTSPLNIAIRQNWTCPYEAITMTLGKFGLILQNTQPVEILQFNGMVISYDLVNEMQKSKSNLSEFEFKDCCFNLTKTEFLKFLERCEKFLINGVSFMIQEDELARHDKLAEQSLLSDEVLDEMLPKMSMFCLNSSGLIRVAFSGTGLTDRLLKEILPKYWPKVFCLTGCRTSFTLDGVLAFVKIAETNEPRIFYDLGNVIVDDRNNALAKIKELVEQLNYNIKINRDADTMVLKFKEDKDEMDDHAYKHTDLTVNSLTKTRGYYDREILLRLLYKE